jgi:hypothetical protein
MGRRAPLGPVEPKNNIELSHGVHSVFLSLWVRGYAPNRFRVWVPQAESLQRESNDVARENALDQLEEARDIALLHSARYQQNLQRYHDKHVHRRDLNVGDLVLRRSQSNKGRHKLTPPWEGPYIIAEVLKLGTYKLSNEKGEIFTNAWNIEQLHRFYS